MGNHHSFVCSKTLDERLLSFIFHAREKLTQWDVPCMLQSHPSCYHSAGQDTPSGLHLHDTVNLTTEEVLLNSRFYHQSPLNCHHSVSFVSIGYQRDKHFLSPEQKAEKNIFKFVSPRCVKDGRLNFKLRGSFFLGISNNKH